MPATATRTPITRMCPARARALICAVTLAAGLDGPARVNGHILQDRQIQVGLREQVREGGIGGEVQVPQDKGGLWERRGRAGDRQAEGFRRCQRRHGGVRAQVIDENLAGRLSRRFSVNCPCAAILAAGRPECRQRSCEKVAGVINREASARAAAPISGNTGATVDHDAACARQGAHG